MGVNKLIRESCDAAIYCSPVIVTGVYRLMTLGLVNKSLVELIKTACHRHAGNFPN